ncbi:hypothetical protein LCGC14_2624970 [marine sediment metagenome]|uniref:Uncharacterized protein n=1 Tax=marine sediment metagenome TaxID=412755 RepID=A0A0F9APK1_9ZZZZ
MDNLRTQVALARGIATDIHLNGFRGKRGQALINSLIGLLVIAIIGIAVVFPVVLDVVNNSTASGTQRTILNILPLLVLVVIVLAFVSVMKMKGNK